MLKKFLIRHLRAKTIGIEETVRLQDQTCSRWLRIFKVTLSLWIVIVSLQREIRTNSN